MSCILVNRIIFRNKFKNLCTPNYIILWPPLLHYITTLSYPTHDPLYHSICHDMISREESTFIYDYMTHVVLLYVRHLHIFFFTKYPTLEHFSYVSTVDISTLLKIYTYFTMKQDNHSSSMLFNLLEIFYFVIIFILIHENVCIFHKLLKCSKYMLHIYS